MLPGISPKNQLYSSERVTIMSVPCNGVTSYIFVCCRIRQKQMETTNNRSWSGPRTVLTKQQATKIYMIGQAARHCGLDPLYGGQSAKIAKMYCVSPKTIRDIWNRRTWQNETRHLWAETDKPMIRYKKFAVSSDQSACPTFSLTRTAVAVPQQNCATKTCGQPLIKRTPNPSSFAEVAMDSEILTNPFERQETYPAAARAQPQSGAPQPCGPAIDCDVDEIVAANLPPPKIPQYSQCAVAQGDCFLAADAAWEGPFGTCLPPASEYDADPFHADWLYW